MEVSSTYNTSFVSDSLNVVKYKALENKAKLIREFKNSLSELICKNPMQIKDLSKTDFMTKFNCQIEGLVGREIQPALVDVYTKYNNKIEQLRSNIKFHIQKEFKVEYYQKKTSKYKKGDVKEYTLVKKETPLTKAMGFFTKYYLIPDFVGYLKRQIEDPKDKPESQIQLYKDTLRFVDKFGDRFYAIADFRYKTIIKNNFSKPILFKELTYSAVNNVKQIIVQNKNEESVIENFIVLSGFGNETEDGKIYIPFKHSKEYHGKDLSVFNKNQPTYKVVFTKKNEVKINLTREGVREYKADGKNILGADVNIKHNLFSASNGKTIEHDKDLLKNYIKTIMKIDKKHDLLYKKDETKLTKQEKKIKEDSIDKLHSWARKMDGYHKRKIHELVVVAKDAKADHISVEDLLLRDKAFIRLAEFFNIKISRLVRMLHLSELKSILETQCSNNGIQLTMVPSYYTSQRCSKCGFVHKDNRKTQEEFECLECGYKANADYNASQNIKQFAEIDVLSQKLLKQNKSNGWLIPKKLGKNAVKKILDSFYNDNLKRSYKADSQEDVGVGGQ